MLSEKSESQRSSVQVGDPFTEKLLLEATLEIIKEKLIVGIDARNGYVATDAWTKVTQIRAIALAKSVAEVGVQTIIYTDISKDGMMEGPSLIEIKALSESVPIDVIASGGVGSLRDLENLMQLNCKNIVGVIIGKAIYEKKFTIKQALQTCSPRE